MWKPQPHCLIDDCLRDESCPSGQCRGPAAPWEDNFPSPDQKSFLICTTPTNCGRKRGSPGSIPLRTVWKPQAYFFKLLIGWGSWSQCAAIVASRDNVEVPQHPGRIIIPESNVLSYLFYSNKRGTKTVIPRVDTTPHGVETPTQGARLLTGVRDASGPNPTGARSLASSTVIEYCPATCC